MEFGCWLEQFRKRLDLSQEALGERTGVDASTISRLERSHTQQVSLSTAFRICAGCGISSAQFLSSLNEMSPVVFAIPEQVHDEQPSFAASLEDLALLIKSFCRQPELVSQWLASHLNDVIYEVHRRAQDQSIPGSLITPKNIEQWLHPSPLYTFTWNYPPVPADTILWTYEQGGALTLSDVNLYGHARLKGYKRYTKLSERSLERIKLEDVLCLDIEAREQGRIFALYWEACRFQECFDPLLHSKSNRSYSSHDGEHDMLDARDRWPLRLALLYIMLYRWKQILFGKESSPPK